MVTVQAAYCASYLLVGIVMASIGPAMIMLAENTGSLLLLLVFVQFSFYPFLIFFSFK
jgi:hypothetical protein